MKAVIIIDGWIKEVDIPRHCLDQGSVDIRMPHPMSRITPEDKDNLMTIAVPFFTCSFKGINNDNVPIFEYIF